MNAQTNIKAACHPATAVEMARQERAALSAKAESEVQRYRPSWAKAVIVAELHENCSDSMTDYFDHKTVRTVVLAWSKHSRDLFAEMRKAAALFPETADLATAPDSAEHREKYSMGAGYYLKDGWRDSSGWCVRKYHGQSLAVAGLEFIESAKGEKPETPANIVAETKADGMRIEQHTHSKKGFEMWIAIMPDRVDRETYLQLLEKARDLGGWYSRAWAGTPAGFAFKKPEMAARFLAGDGSPLPDGPNSEGPKPSRPAKPAGIPANHADKLRKVAESMQGKIDDCFRDRPANTPKRARQAAQARNDGTRWQRAQRIASALAVHHEAGTVPPLLASVASRAALYDLANEAADHSGGYYDAPRLLGSPYAWPDEGKAAQAVAAWSLLSAPDPQQTRAEELRRKVSDLSFAKIEGYFPTPAAIVADMIERAGIQAGAEVLEPSAGSGAIADALKAEGVAVACIERHGSLAEVLRLKGHNVHQGDFLENIPSAAYDAVIMNPPFERGQDCAHVRHAWGYVKAGGSLVAIMGAGVTFRQNAPYSTFREWLAEVGGSMEEITAGAFKESGTGVASVMVTIQKGNEA